MSFSDLFAKKIAEKNWTVVTAQSFRQPDEKYVLHKYEDNLRYRETNSNGDTIVHLTSPPQIFRHICKKMAEKHWTVVAAQSFRQPGRKYVLHKYEDNLRYRETNSNGSPLQISTIGTNFCNSRTGSPRNMLLASPCRY